jgi:DNA-binding IclR family transcriptional regulator
LILMDEAMVQIGTEIAEVAPGAVRENRMALDGGTQLLHRAATLLRLIAGSRQPGMRLKDLADRAELKRSTTHRILQGLIAEGLLTQHKSTHRYALGVLAYEIGLAASTRFNLREHCQGHLKMVAEATGDVTFLTVRSDLDGVCIDRREGSFPVKVFILDIGGRRPLGVGAGSLAILAALPPSEAAWIIKSISPRLRQLHPYHHPEALEQRLVVARERGYSVFDPPEARGIRSVGMASVGADGRPLAAVSIATLSTRLGPARLKDALDALRAATEGIARDVEDMHLDS